MAEETLIKQIGKKVEYLSGYTITTETYIGPDDEIATKASQNVVGGKYDGLSSNIRSSITEKIEADRSKWTVVYGKQASSGGGDNDDLIKQTWTMTMTQYEYPLEKYLSADEAGQVAAWEQTDIKHKKNFEFFVDMSQTGAVYQMLAGKALQVAKKKFAGIESVLKFYPQATCTSLYGKYSSFTDRANKLNHIDDSSLSSDFGLGVHWLKSGFDWTQNQDGTWTLTESWIGSPKWDEDLYGENAWSFVEP